MQINAFAHRTTMMKSCWRALTADSGIEDALHCQAAFAAVPDACPAQA